MYCGPAKVKALAADQGSSLRKSGQAGSRLRSARLSSSGPEARATGIINIATGVIGSPRMMRLAEWARLEPATPGFGDRCSTN